jgi:hypothetical protein
MSNSLARGLNLLDCSQYYEKLTKNGVDSWDTFLLLTNEDLEGLDIEPSDRETIHRMKSLLELSQSQNVTSTPGSNISGQLSNLQGHGFVVSTEEAAFILRKKRKYQRHPKPDSHAPAKPPTAYVVFANEYRKSLTEDRSFADIAKDVGQAWQALSAEEKAIREDEADKWRKQYREALRDYKSTKNHREYMKYLKHFQEDENKRIRGHNFGLLIKGTPQGIGSGSTATIPNSSSMVSIMGEQAESTQHMDDANTVASAQKVLRGRVCSPHHFLCLQLIVLRSSILSN